MLPLFPIFLLLYIPLSGTLDELEKKVEKELHYIERPAPWIEEVDAVLDVAIIGSGMAGLTTGFALQQLGIDNILIFDGAEEGLEGPWRKEARMKILRTDKCATGPSLGIPCLTFQSYYEAKYGELAWGLIDKASPDDWMDYLIWYRKVLNLPVKNNFLLKTIEPLNEQRFKLTFQTLTGELDYTAKKVVLATGRSGLGGVKIPEFMKKIPKEYFSHTIDPIDKKNLEGKKIGIIGCGAAGFDVAGVALEAKAQSVDLLYRREKVPEVNDYETLLTPGFEVGFHFLDDSLRYRLISGAILSGTPPPEEALLRVIPYNNFRSTGGVHIEKVETVDKQLHLKTTKGNFSFDYLILATGYEVDVAQMEELRGFSSSILLWKDVLKEADPSLGKFPYLGDHYQFIEKKFLLAPFLKNIYCFNYGALLSHGLTSSSIDGISTGAKRVAEGIARDFYLESQKP